MEMYRNELREKIIGLDSKITLKNGNKSCQINFDNAATTPPLKSVIDYINLLSNYYASIGRGTGQKASFTTKIYNEAREYLLDFFNIKNKDKYTVIFVHNTTEGINKIAQTLVNKKDVVLTTRMEHHSNDLPWRENSKVDYVEVDELGRIDFNSLNEKINEYNGNIKFLSITGASNVTGYMNEIYKASKLIHKAGGKIIVDGAQLVPHVKVDMSGKSSDDYIDFLVFSAHKLYAPFGGGAIICKKDEFNSKKPNMQGGGTVELVKDFDVEYLNTPEKNEAGTPNFFGIASLVKALEELDKIGFNKLIAREKMLLGVLNEGLKNINNIVLYGDCKNIQDRLGIEVFNIKGIYHRDVAKLLAEHKGIAVRHGWFCAHPYCRRLMGIDEIKASEYLIDNSKKMYGMVRVSLSPYNTIDEIYDLLNELEYISKNYSKKI